MMDFHPFGAVARFKRILHLSILNSTYFLFRGAESNLFFLHLSSDTDDIKIFLVPPAPNVLFFLVFYQSVKSTYLIDVGFIEIMSDLSDLCLAP